MAAIALAISRATAQVCQDVADLALADVADLALADAAAAVTSIQGFV